jgi:hypothetical protein
MSDRRPSKQGNIPPTPSKQGKPHSETTKLTLKYHQKDDTPRPTPMNLSLHTQANFFLPLFRTDARGRRDYHVQSLLPASAGLLLLTTTVATTTTLVSFICWSACD